jgi:hypothetical protein
LALNIFISSVFLELKDERLGLEEEIQKLQDLFVGMEYFGSDPNPPAIYDDQKIATSDLYVGLFARDYGSIEELTGKSFTQLEYEAARRRQIPCLIYFKQEPPSTEIQQHLAESADSKYAAFRALLRRQHIVQTFRDTTDLKNRFLVDFIKLLRTSLFERAGALDRGMISVDAMRAVTSVLTPEQIRAVGQEKYIPEIYISRDAEAEIEEFVNFEQTFRKKARGLLAELNAISRAPNLASALEAVHRTSMAIEDSHRLDQFPRMMEELKTAFHYNEVAASVEEILNLLQEPSETLFKAKAFSLGRLQSRPFVNQAHLELLPKYLLEAWKQTKVKGKLDSTWTALQSILQIFPSTDLRLVNTILQELEQLINLNKRRCACIVDRAGTGKTNIMCHLTAQLAKKYPIFLLSGQMQISSEYDITVHIQRRLEQEFRSIFSDWMPRLIPSLEAAGTWMFILIDGINENLNIALLVQLLKNFIPKLQNTRIKLVLSCRDVLWDRFAATLKPHLFLDRAVRLREFSDGEWNRAVGLYFESFQIRVQLAPKAAETLRHPLLLRFFCEAYRGREHETVNDVRIISVLDLYVANLCQNIAERVGLVSGDSVLALMTDIARVMWFHKASTVGREKLNLEVRDLSKEDSVYTLIRSENIIFEEKVALYTADPQIRFVFDEFMEYMIARFWISELGGSGISDGAVEELLQQAVSVIPTFSATIGALIFADKMLKRGGHLINKVIMRLFQSHETFFADQQNAMIYAFENMATDHVEDGLVIALESFEDVAREDLKERLASVIIRALRLHPESLPLYRLVRKLLEVDLSSKSAGEEIHERGIASKPPSPDEVRTTYLEQLRTSHAEFAGTIPLEMRTELAEAAEKHLQANRDVLPPARHHYSDEIKLTAISILVTAGSTHAYEIAEKGIRQLGQLELNSALQALAAVDLGKDEQVYETIVKNMTVRLPEYRIFCGWLLRKRYGSRAADTFLTLLTDQETRVHRYAFQLFNDRRIESELIAGIILTIQKPGLKSWHLAYLLKLLGRRRQFTSPDIVKLWGEKIVESLMAYSDHPNALLRKLALRGMIELSEFADLDTVRRRLESEEDPSVKSLQALLR